MRRMSEEDGAIAVLVAFLIVALVGMGALVLDVGLMYWESRQLQNGADAAALAVAQDCAVNPCNDRDAVAQAYANDNSNDGASTAAVRLPGIDGDNSVTVETTTLSDSGEGFLTHTLAGVLGVPTSSQTRSATARWGYFGGGNTIPLTFSVCEWDIMTGGLGVAALPTAEETVYFHRDSSNANPCGGPANMDYPGGFGWLDPDLSGDVPPCTATISSIGTVEGDTGSGRPQPDNQTGCTVSHMQSLLGQTVLMPIFTTVTPPPGKGTYQIIGFAALEFTGFRFGGGPDSGTVAPKPIPCSGSDRCVRGRFVNYYDLGSEPSDTAPNFGVTAIALSR
jgi:hypothetical protein